MIENKEINAVEALSLEEALEKENWISPAINIDETNDDYFVSAMLPGVKKENITVKSENKDILIIGRIDFQENAKKNYILRETPVANYIRRFKLSDGIDASSIEANFADGVLRIKLPKLDRIKPKEISIK